MKTWKKTVCTVLMMVCLCTGAMAQKSIDKLMDELEKSSQVQVTSVVKRDPKTRKIVKMTKTLSFNNNGSAVKRLIAAFEKEEEVALSVVKDRRQSYTSFTLTFEDKKEKRTYMLSTTGLNKGKVSLYLTPAGEQDDTAWMLEMQKDISDFSFDDKQFAADMQKHQRDMKKYQKDMQRYQRDVQRSSAVSASGDVYVNGKKLKKGTHKVNGRTIIVR